MPSSFLHPPPPRLPSIPSVFVFALPPPLPAPPPSSSGCIHAAPPNGRVPLPVLQWSYAFYLTHKQGQSGFEFFFKTKELKKKWLEQFDMAM